MAQRSKNKKERPEMTDIEKELDAVETLGRMAGNWTLRCIYCRETLTLKFKSPDPVAASFMDKHDAKCGSKAVGGMMEIDAKPYPDWLKPGELLTLEKIEAHKGES